MRTINDLRSESWKSRFVGRSSLLDRMQRIADGTHSWQMLHFHGPLGIGKTSLFKRFERLQAGKPVLVIDGQRGIEQPQTFLDRLAELVKAFGIDSGDPNLAELAAILAHWADEAEGLVLLIDGLDLCLPIEEWLREQFLPALSYKVKVFTAGRLPLTGHWFTAPGWADLAANVPLPPLRKEEWLQYTTAIGITEFRQLDAIGRLAAGIPLALTIACQAVLRASLQECGSPGWLRHVSQDMESALFQDSRLSETNQSLLTASSLLYRFDQELLGEVLERELGDDEFRSFCQTAYVTVKAPNGWKVVDGFRHWIRNNFRERMPETYKQLRSRAWHALNRRLEVARSADSEQELELWFEQLYLNENEFLHHYTVFGNDEHYEFRSAAEAELPLLQAMYRNAFAALSPFMSDDTHQEQYLPEIWRAEPDCIHVITRHGVIEGFHSLVPLNERTRPIFARNPLLQRFITGSNPEPDEYLFWIGATRFPMDPDAISFLFRHIFIPSIRGKLATIVITMPEVVEAFRYFGFERLPWAECRSSGGLNAYAARLDWRSESAERSGGISATLSPFSRLGEEDRLSLVKLALSQYPHLKRGRKLECGNNPLLQLEPVQGWPLLLEEGLRSMAEGSRQEQAQAQVLRLFYIQKIGSHEAVASRLDLPLSTYFRYLKRGIMRITSALEDLKAEWE